MKIFYLLLLILSVMTYPQILIYEISYGKEHEIRINPPPNTFVPSNINIYFRIKVPKNENLRFEIKVMRNTIINSQLHICGFPARPSEIQMIKGDGTCVINLAAEKTMLDANNERYLYDLDKIEDSNYLSILIENYQSFHNVSVKLFQK